MRKMIFSQTSIPPSERDNFRRKRVFDNMHRAEILAVVIVIFEFLFILADISASLLNVDSRFYFDEYLLMYSILIGINILFLVKLRVLVKMKEISDRHIKSIDTGITIYVTTIMSWGSVLSLMDQKLYGQLMVFMIMMIISSVIFYLENQKMLFSYIISVLIVSVGLPFFQSSKDVLIGDYINLSVFIVTSWIASRIIYMSYINDYNASSLLHISKALVEDKIRENQNMNHKLILANLQLKQMALLDDLTGIPNRRAFRNFIDVEYDRYGEVKPFLSVLFIDIDQFKRYNDIFGHDVGDKVLVGVSETINAIKMNLDEAFFCRWGGDEFVISIFGSSQENILNLAETVRKNVYQLAVPSEVSQTDIKLSVSIGIGIIKSAEKENVSRVFHLADEALQLAKNNGRNCIESICSDY